MEHTRLDEHFFDARPRPTHIDLTLPIRLQKRQLLQGLGFPPDPHLVALQMADHNSLERALASQSSFPFIILFSERPMVGWKTPLIIVRSARNISFRSRDGNICLVGWHEIPNIISQSPPQGWVEITRPIWGQDVIAGQLVYHNASSQFLEIQEGVDAHNIGEDLTKPYFYGQFCHFRTEEDLRLKVAALQADGFSRIFGRGFIKQLMSKLGEYKIRLDKLATISKSPSLEFAYQLDNFFFLDVDWPAQWLVGS